MAEDPPVLDPAPAPTGAMLKRQEELPQHIRDLAWKAQLRLCARYRHLWAKGKAKQLIVTAIARELCAFMWAIAKQTHVPAAI